MGLSEKAYLSEIEYFAEEKKASQKHEYFAGEIYAMSGASIQHNRISRNLLVILAYRLIGKGCESFGSDLRIHIPSNSLYTYPDVSIFCGEVEKAETDFDTAVNPKVIIEVFSKSNRNHDKGTKFSFYREIASLDEYIIIDCESVQIETWVNNHAGTWVLRDIKSMDNVLELKSLGVEIRLSEIYEGVF